MDRGPNNAMGPSAYNGPHGQELVQGWDIRPVTSWTLAIGQEPA